MWIDLLSNLSMNFVPSKKLSANKEVLFPIADVQSKDYAATIAVTVNEMFTVVNVAEMTGAPTVNVTIDSQVTAGAILLMKLQSDTTARNVTLGTGLTGTTVAGVISKTKYAMFVYDGTSFIHVATNQVD